MYPPGNNGTSITQYNTFVHSEKMPAQELLNCTPYSLKRV